MGSRACAALLLASLLLHCAARAQGPAFQVEELATGLKAPTSLVFLPDGRGLLAERRSARVSLLDPATSKLTPLADGFEGLALTGGDAGVHDLALHPDHARNGWIYVSYSSGDEYRSTTVVDRFRIRGDRIAERSRIFTANAYSEDRAHYGGRMVFSGGYLFLTIGDRHHQARAQELTNHAGKILRLRDDGSAPADNPFADRGAHALAEIWTYGHRNPQGLHLDAATGDLWSHEHGPMGGDELNLIRRGANYGWPVISYGWEYSGGPIGMGITRQQGMEQPAWVWTPAIAPSGMTLYRGESFPQWRGSFLIGSMSQQHLNRIAMADGRVVLEERILNRKAGRVRLVAEGPDGLVYLGSDDGRLVRLRPTSTPPAPSRS